MVKNREFHLKTALLPDSKTAYMIGRFSHLKIASISLLLLFGIITGVLGGILFAVTRDVPQIRALESFQPSSISRVYSADNVLLAELFVERRHPVPLDKIPNDLKLALITTEDRTFYQHGGVDLKGILRAAIKDIYAGRFAEGASTISQQLAKTLFLTPEKKLIRKIKEAFLTFQLERRYTKDEILELYLNQIYFGSGAYGVESAARIFFGKSVDELSLSECALIAAMPKAPSRYSPWVNRDLALKRRATVLEQMKHTGAITASQYQIAIAEPLLLKARDKTVKAPYFVAYARAFLEEKVGSSQLYKGGLTVHTTLSHGLQLAAERAVSEGMATLEKRMRRNRIQDPDPQCGLISLNIHTGEILAMIGGKNYGRSRFNRATSANRQPGSAFKPIVYAYAVEQGSAQNRMILDAPVVFKGARSQEDYSPSNYTKTFLGEITLRQALALSKNIPAVRLLQKLGPEAVIHFAHGLGIKSALSPDLSLALGSSGVNLIDLTTAYAVFGNGGKLVEPHGIASVVDSRGRDLWHATPRQVAVMSPAGAGIITDMLEAVVQEGTGRKAQSLRRPVAGKTGTSNDFRDALFVGFSPTIAAGVWVGNDAYSTLGPGESGSRAALPIWIAYMSSALANTPYEVFAAPDETIRVHMNLVSGHLSADSDGASVSALFRKGTEPR